MAFPCDKDSGERIKLEEETSMKMKLGTIVRNDESPEVPQLEVQEIGINGEVSNTYYLTPFRTYGFQVSKTITGINTMGRSEFVGLQNIVKNNDKWLTKEIMKAMIMEAIHDYNSRWNDQNWSPDYQETKTIFTFIDQSIKWVSDVHKVTCMQEA